MKAVDILYVEDDALDVDLAQNALSVVCKQGSYTLAVVEDGEQALQFLNRSIPFADATVPDLILLDLNLPKIHGKEVLRMIKSSESLKRIPVIVLTTSLHQADVDDSYMLGASAYLNKPAELREYHETFKAINDFWFHAAHLPSKFPTRPN